MRILIAGIFVTVYLSVFLPLISVVPIVHFSVEDDEVLNAGDAVESDGGDDDDDDDDSAALKKSLHHYCLFHVDLRCRDTCIELGFSDGKCYKGVCVCKGAEKNAIRMLRLSGHMIVPYLSGELATAVAATDQSVFDESFADRAIVYDKEKLDDLVQAGQEEKEEDDEALTTMTPKTLMMTTTRRPPVRLNVLEDTTSYENAMLASSVTAGNHENRSAHSNHHHQNVTMKHPAKHRHHQHKHRHRHGNEDIIFELGQPQNLRGTILGVAKEYDPQHLFSGEEVNSSAFQQPVTAYTSVDGNLVPN